MYSFKLYESSFDILSLYLIVIDKLNISYYSFKTNDNYLLAKGYPYQSKVLFYVIDYWSLASGVNRRLMNFMYSCRFWESICFYSWEPMISTQSTTQNSTWLAFTI